jgi:hypothetical protein
MLRSRRLIHGLIGAGVSLAIAGLYRRENSGSGEQILTDWEYGFRDSTVTVGGRHNPPDNRLVFLGTQRLPYPADLIRTPNRA